MRRKILFVMPGLAAGGGERSLVNLLSQINYERFDVDLFLLSHEGMFMELVPKQVRILPLPDEFRRFSQPLVRSIQHYLLRGNMMMAYNRASYMLLNRLVRSGGKGEQKSWKYVAAAMERLNGPYDVAIGFLEKTSVYFCVEMVNARKKIGWIHNDYDKLGMSPTFDQAYFRQLDHIVTVSEECANVLKRRFPAESGKVDVIHNIVSPTVIQRLAESSADGDAFQRENGEMIILSIGRLHAQKGFELAIHACRRLIDQGFRLRWFVIGEGEERNKLTKLIEEQGLRHSFQLLGLKTNPYPYIKQADIYAQTSLYEGKSIAIDEAKILGKPIVITNFSTAHDQIKDGVEGLIAEMNADAIAADIARLLQDRRLRQQLSNHLAQLQLGTEGEIGKLYKLLG